MSTINFNIIQLFTQLHTVFKNNILAMADMDGLILASTDPKQVGLFHEGARKVIDERLESLMTPCQGHAPATRMDLSLPLVVDGAAVGAAVVRGEVKETMRHGNLLKKTMEYLLRESDAVEQKKMEENARHRFMEQWLTQKEAAASQQFIKRGLSLGIDITAEYRVIIIEVEGIARVEYTDTIEDTVAENVIFSKIYDLLSEEVQSVRGHSTHIDFQVICCVPLRSNSMVLGFSTKIRQLVEERYAKIVKIGIDEKAENVSVSLKKAKKALERSLRMIEEDINLYENIDIDIFIDEVQDEIKQQYINKIYKNCTEEEIEEIIHIVNSYFKNNRSIAETSSELFMHKNTLQYKIKKILSATGYDMRDVKDATVLYLAGLFKSSQNVVR